MRLHLCLLACRPCRASSLDFLFVFEEFHIKMVVYCNRLTHTDTQRAKEPTWRLLCSGLPASFSSWLLFRPPPPSLFGFCWVASACTWRQPGAATLPCPSSGGSNMYWRGPKGAGIWFGSRRPSLPASGVRFIIWLPFFSVPALGLQEIHNLSATPRGYRATWPSLPDASDFSARPRTEKQQVFANKTWQDSNEYRTIGNI